jgi:hypothetical protein
MTDDLPDLFAATKQGRIGGFPYDPRASVQSFWGLGLRRLRAYRKEWDENRGVRKDRPRHDDASHGADAFLTFACSGYQPPSAYVHRKRILRGIV